MQKYKVRSGTIDSGKDYEFKMASLLSLRCIFHGIEDMWIASNAGGIGAFDDIVLHIQTISNSLTFLMQLKHKENPKNIVEQEFAAVRGDFSLVKYFSDIVKLKQCLECKSEKDGIVNDLGGFDNLRFVLFTNRGVNKYEFLEKCDDDLLGLILNTNGINNDNVYKFKCEKLSCNIRPDYCENFCLISNQIHAKDADEEIIAEVKKIADLLDIKQSNIKTIATTFTAYITDWAKGNLGGNYYLTKKDIIRKLTQLFFNQYTISFNEKSYFSLDLPREQTWHHLISKKQMTIVNLDDTILKYLKKYIAGEVAQYHAESESAQSWSYELPEQARNIFYQNHPELKPQMLKIVGNHGKITLLDIYKCLWFDGKLPLLLQINQTQDYENIKGIMKLSEHNLKIIVINNSDLKLTTENIPGGFVTLLDLNPEDRAKTLNCSVKLQGRPNVILHEIIDESMYEYINCNDIINILTNNFNVGNEYEPLFEYFINRSLSKVFLKLEVLKKVTNEIFLVQASSDHLKDLNIGSNVIKEEENVTEQIEKFKSTKKAVHRLIFHPDENLLEWEGSCGTTKNIRPYQFVEPQNLYKEKNKNLAFCWTDLDGVLQHNILKQTHIISAGPGMGKTMLMDFIARRAPENLWVLKVNLNEHNEYYENFENNRTSDEINRPVGVNKRASGSGNAHRNKRGSLDDPDKNKTSSDDPGDNKRASGDEHRNKGASSDDLGTKKTSSDDPGDNKRTTSDPNENKRALSDAHRNKKASPDDSGKNKTSLDDPDNKRATSDPSKTKRASGDAHRNKRASSDDSDKNKTSSDDPGDNKRAMFDPNENKRASGDTHINKGTSSDDLGKNKTSLDGLGDNKRTTSDPNENKRASSDAHRNKGASPDDSGKNKTSSDDPDEDKRATSDPSKNKRASGDAHRNKRASPDDPGKNKSDPGDNKRATSDPNENKTASSDARRNKRAPSNDPGKNKTSSDDPDHNKRTSNYYDKNKNTSDLDRNSQASTYLRYFNNQILLKQNPCEIELAKSVFELFLNKKQVLVLLDGFDEISISYKDQVTEIAKCLHKEGFPLWLTTRTIMKSHLEEQLNVIATTIKPFTMDDQRNFLIKYFSNVNSEIVSNSDGIIEKFVQELLEAAKRNLNDNDGEFTGIPLQTKLLADVFNNDCIKSIRTGIVALHKKFDLLYLYEEFVKEKIRILCDKFGKGARDMRKFLLKHQRLFALKILFKTYDLRDLNIDEQLTAYYHENELLKIQILQKEGVLEVQKVNNQITVNFVHRTFAEFLAAQWLSENFNSNDDKIKKTAQNLVKLRFPPHKDHPFLFNMLDRILTKDCALHSAILNGQTDQFDQIIKSDMSSVYATDKSGRTILHIIAINGIYHPDRPFFNECVGIKDKMVEVIEKIPRDIEANVQDNLLGYNPLDYALISYSLSVANKLSEKFPALTISTEIGFFTKDEYFAYCAWLDYKSLFKILLPYFAADDLLINRWDKNTTIESYCVLNRYHTVLYSKSHVKLHKYAKEFNVTTISQLFQMNNPNREDNYYTDLRFATVFGTEDNIKYLIAKGEEVNKRDVHDDTPLHYAITHKRSNIARFLLCNGAEVNKTGKRGNTALHCSAENNCNGDLISDLISNGADMDKLNNHHNTPLHLALMNHDKTNASLLISHGANVNITNNEGKSSLHIAAEYGYHNVVSEILCRGGDANKLTPFYNTPLHLALMYNHTDTAKLILSKSTINNRQDKAGFSVIHYAAQAGDSEIVSELLRQGVEATRINNDGDTPLHIAAKKGKMDTVRILLDLTKSADVQNKNGHTPLHLSVIDQCFYNNSSFKHQISTIQLLLDKGANIDMKDFDDNTALHYASRGHAQTLCYKLQNDQTKINIASFYKETVLLLLDRQAKENIKNNEGKTCLDLATEMGQTEIISLLRRNSRSHEAFESQCSDGQEGNKNEFPENKCKIS